MPALISRRIVRRTAARDTANPPFCRDLIVEIEPGGKLFRLRPSGTRGGEALTWQEVWAYAMRRKRELLRRRHD